MQKTKRKYTEKILEYQANVEKLEHQHESQSNTIKMMREEHQANRQALSTVKLSLSTTQQTLAEELLSRRAYEKKLEEKTEELRRGWAREQELVQCVSEQREALLAMNEWKEGRVEKDRREQKAKQLEEKQKKKDNDDRNQLQAERQEGSQRQRQRISALAAMVKKQHACNRRLLGVMGLMWIKKKKQNEQREREEEKVSKERLSLMQVLTAERERYKREIEGKEEALRKQQQTYLKMEMAKERRRGEITKANEINQQNELELSREQYDLRKSAPRPIEEKGREEKVMAYLSLPAADVVELQSESESDDVDPCAREEDGDDDDDGSMNESKSKERDEFEHESEKQGHPGHESDASDESDDGADTESDEDNDFYSHDTYQLSLDQWKYSVQTRQPTLFHRHSLPVYAESAVPLSTKVITSNTPREGHANSLNYTNGEAGNSDGAFPHHRPPLSQHEQQAPVLITDIFRGKAILKSISSTSNPRLEKTRAKSLSIPYCNLGDIYCRSKHSHNQSPTLSHTNYHNLLTSEPSPSSFPSPSPSHSQLSLQQAHSTNQWYPYIPPHTQQEQKYQQYQRQQFPPTLEKVGRTKKKTSTRRSEGNIRGNKHSKRSKCRENNMTEGGAMVFQTPSLSYFSKSKSMKASKSTRGLQTHYIYNTEDGNSTRNTKGGGKRNKTKCKASSIKTHSDTGRRKLARSQSMVLRKEEEYLLGTNAHLYARTPIYAPYTTDRGKKTRKKRKASRVRV